MMTISPDILIRFDEVLKKRSVPEPLHLHYRKWLRYFLDFCNKYPPPEAKSEQVRLFIDKLQSQTLFPQNAQDLCELGAKVSTLPARQAARRTFLGRCKRVPHLPGREESGRRLHSKSSLQCLALPFPACPQKGFRRPTGCAPRQKIAIYPGGSFPAGSRRGHQASRISL